MAQSQPGAHVAPKAPSLEQPAAGNSGVFLSSLLLALILGGFFCLPMAVPSEDGQITGYAWKWSSLFDGKTFATPAMVYLILCAVAALALLVMGLFIRNALRGAVYAILGLAGVGVIVWMLLTCTQVGTPAGPVELTRYLPPFAGLVLGGTMPAQMSVLFVLGVALLFAAMIGAARARVLFPDNGSSKAWSVITALGLLAIFAAPAVMNKTYETWKCPIPVDWAAGATGKTMMDAAIAGLAGLGTLLLVLTSLFGVAGGKSSRGRGVFVMGIGMAIAIGLPVYYYLARPELLTVKLATGDDAFKWVLDEKQIFLAGASAWAFFAMIGLGISDLICQGQVKKLASVAGGEAPRSVKVAPTGGQPVGQFNRAATLSPQQQRLDEIAKLYNAGLLSEDEYNRRRAEIMGR